MIKSIMNKKSVRLAAAFAVSALAVILFMLFTGVSAEAKTVTIKSPAQMRNLNKNYKSGSFKLGVGMDLTKDMPSDEYGTVLLTKGRFVIDLNGNTLQSTDTRCAVISIRGASVTIKDSKAKKASRGNPSVRSYGLGAIELVSGSLTIKNGYYCGASNGQNNPSALYVGGGTCTVQGGTFDGDYIGAASAGGKLRVNGGTFKTSYFFGLCGMGGKISITRATVRNTKQDGFNPTFALGAVNNSTAYYNFSKWLASGSRFSPTIRDVYWGGSGQEVSQYPYKMVSYITSPYKYAASYTGASLYKAQTVKITSKGAPAATSIKSLKPRSKGLTVKWAKKTSKTTGYQVQYSTSSKFGSDTKTLTVKGKNKTSAVIKNLKGGKKYYVRVRTYRSINGTKLTSKWSKAKSAKTKT